MQKKNCFKRLWIFIALFAGIHLIPALRAQPTEQTVQSRFLLIFDTSLDMKYRVDGVQKALNTMLATSVSGELHAGDSIGVWTFGHDLRPGDYPLQGWDPDKAVMIASNLTRFVGEQHYAKSARFEALQPLLNEVVRNSERLTVLIFCSGEAKASGTPYDAGINQFFQQKLDGQKSAHQPFVIVLRSQMGNYASCAMGLPPQPVTFPGFPPLPAPPPPPAPKVTNAPPPAPVSTVPPLIIVGTKIESSLPSAQTETTNPPPVTNPPVEIEPVPLPVAPPAVPVVPTNPPVVPVVPTNASVAPAAPTNAPVVPPASPVVAKTTTASALTNPPAPVPGNSVFGGVKNLFIGAGLMGAVILLGILVRLRLHRKNSSLITRSMTDRR